jgi:tetratricopeptide (TPR) repeat protein
MYQRGITLAEATAKKEFLYINYWDRRAHPLNASELDEQQVARMRVFGEVTVSHRATISRRDAVTRLRIAEVGNYKCLEVTGFLEFDKVIFFAVLLTPTETQRSNIRRLESVMKTAVPIDFKRDNHALIARINEQLKEDVIPPERARLLRNMGHWYRDMDQLQEAKACLEESLALDPNGSGGYWTINELLPVLVGLDDKKRAIQIMNHLLRLDPSNPTVFNDCFKFSAGWIERAEVLQATEMLKAEHADNELIQANCDYYAGNILTIDDPDLAKRRFTVARNVFRKHFPRNHQVFRAITLALKQLRGGTTNPP